MAMEKKLTGNRDGALESPWQTSVVPLKTPPAVPVDLVYDVLVIGGGLTGLTTALLLQNSGKRCLVVEAQTIGFGTTGGTSAHINTFADTTYQEARDAFGSKGAKLFAEAVNEGFGLIKQNIKTYKIACDFQVKKGFVYAENKEQVQQLEDLCQGMHSVGLDCEYTEAVPTPVPYEAAVVIQNQAQFHPLKYLQGLQKAYLKAGGLILENTRIDSVKIDGKVHFARSGDQLFKASQVVYATHVPPGITIFSFRCAPYRSYVLGIKLKEDSYPDALVYDLQEPYHYVRTQV